MSKSMATAMRSRRVLRTERFSDEDCTQRLLDRASATDRLRDENMSGYSGTPLAKKLGIKQGFSLTLVDAPEEFEELLEGLPDDVEPARGLKGRALVDVIVVFVKRKADLEKRFAQAAARLSEQVGAGIWVAWPKKASGVATDITEDVVREVCLPSGLVDNKVCAIDGTWSGLRMVRRRK
jgi:hypothetical protein